MTYITRLIALAATLAGASGVLASPQGEPLDPEKAFRASARLAAGSGIDVSFRILDGYYLYRDRFRVSIEPASLPVGPIVTPAGEKKDDPFIGPTEILKHSALVRVPFTSPPVRGTYVLQVTAQGCAEDRVCYAPFTQTLRISIP